MRGIGLALQVICTLLIILFPAARAEPQRHAHIEVELIAEWQAWQPGTVNWLGVAMRPDPHWHTYWQNAGDSGLAPTLQWQLPAGFHAGDIAWELPQRVSLSGITNFGYLEDSLLMVPISLPRELAADAYTVAVDASWLVCKEACIPGEARLSLTLPVNRLASPTPGNQANLFAVSRSRLPKPQPAVSVVYAQQGDSMLFQLSSLPAMPEGALDLFAVDDSLLAASDVPRWHRDDGLLQARVAVSEYFTGLPARAELVLTVGGAVAYQLTGVAGQLRPLDETASAPTTDSLPLLMGMALLGGVLLNLMPCVFPVLSLKAVSLVQLSGAATAQARLHGWLYQAGIALSLLALAALLLALKQAGASIGWGFQLQEPGFLAVLAVLMLLMGLSLMGAFELAGRWMGAGQQLTGGHSNAAAFFSGCLAVVIASPCMTPLMAPALAAALSLPALSMISILLALGFGLGLPIWLLSQFPRLARWLPRPGRWMETFKQAMAFPLFLTAIWLLWLLQRHGPAWVSGTLLLALLLAFMIWLVQRGFRRTAWASLSALVATGLWLWLAPDRGTQPLSELAETYTADRLSEYHNRNQPVLVNITADWCLTCQVNERVTFRHGEVEALFESHAIGYLVGDWTRRDATLTRYLAQYQQVGVPLYVFYDKRGKATVLPQLLTPAGLIQTLQSSLHDGPVTFQALEPSP